MLSTLARPRRWTGALAAAAFSLVASTTGQAQSYPYLQTGHSIPGFYGLESSVPPPLGLSFENTTMYYRAATQRDRDGNEVSGSDDVSLLMNNSTITWMSPWLLFGAHWVMRARVPITDLAQNPSSTLQQSGSFNLGDIFLEPLVLYWEGSSHFFSLGYGYWVNTGEFKTGELDNPGKGFRTHQATAGVTFFPGEKRDWHISVLGRYEYHEEMDDLTLTPGQNVVFDLSIGKHLGERWNVGVLGYSLWQVSQESGEDGNITSGFYEVAAIGAEARYAMPDWGGDIQLRALQEYNAHNRPEGQVAFLGLRFSL